MILHLPPRNHTVTLTAVLGFVLIWMPETGVAYLIAPDPPLPAGQLNGPLPHQSIICGDLVKQSFQDAEPTLEQARQWAVAELNDRLNQLLAAITQRE